MTTTGWKDKRRHQRRQLTYQAEIITLDEANVLRCVVLDVSDTGARLLVDPADMVPQDFILALTSNRQVLRVCRTVRRSEDEIGVRFKNVAASDVIRPARRILATSRPTTYRP